MRTWQVSDVMTTNVATIGPETPYRDVVDLLAQRRISAVPVVDEFGRALGVVSETDLLHKVELIGEPHEWRLFEGHRRREARTKADAGKAGDLMTSPAITIYPSTPVAAAARMMDREQVKRLPVTDDLGRVVGIVTRGDLLKVHLRPDDDIRTDVTEEVVVRALGLRADAVTVTVAGGVVTLAGKLDRWTMTEAAVRLSRQVSGVVEVRDELTFDIDDRPLVDSGAWSGQPPFVA
jgi:CBS domain-containing protein